MPYVDFLIVVISFILIAKGADWFIDSSARIAEITAVPKFIVGALLIGLFTNLPEFVVAIIAALKNYPTIALGNAVGSIAFNTGVVLGVTLFMIPVKIDKNLLKQQGTWMIVSGLFLYAFAFLGKLGLGFGLLLVLGFIAFVYFSINHVNELHNTQEPAFRGRANHDQNPASQDTLSDSVNDPEIERYYDVLSKSALKFIAGGVMLIFGSHLLVNSGVHIAQFFGVPEIVIATTLIAGGTSLPELAAALSALAKGHSDLSLGTIIGSNTLNVLGTIGLGALFRTIPVSRENLILDLPVMLLFMYLILLWGLRKDQFDKKNGVVLVCCFLAYMYVLLFAYPAFA